MTNDNGMSAADKQITIKVKSVYGRQLAYPACRTSRRFAVMLGTTTLTAEALEHIKTLGYTIKRS